MRQVLRKVINSLFLAVGLDIRSSVCKRFMLRSSEN